MFEFKGADWQATFDQNRPLISENTSNVELFEILGNMILSLRDGHNGLIDFSRDTFKTYDILKGAPINYNTDIIFTYINSIMTGEFQFFQEDNSIYTILQGNIGYMYISTFNVDLPEEEINMILSHFKDTKGLIIDVRSNTGGDPESATRLAGHLTDGRSCDRF